MAFLFTKSNCVAVGTFNMYIIQPTWLAKRSIIPDAIEIKIEANLEEPGLRFSSPSLATQWVVTPARLLVESEEWDEDCGSHIAKVIDELPWTPLVAIGTNTIYEARHSDLPTPLRFLRGDGYPKLPRGFRKEQTSYVYAVRKTDHVFSLSFELLQDTIRLKTNVHTHVKGKDSTFANRAANAFVSNRTEAEKLLAKLFGIKVERNADDA